MLVFSFAVSGGCQLLIYCKLNAPVAGRQTIFRVPNIFMTSRKLFALNVSALAEIYLSMRHTAPFQTNIT
jgi:hypothetical protein